MKKETDIIVECFSLCERPFNVNETKQILKMSARIVLSWGISKSYGLEGKGLMLKVNGNHHKGWVLITLGWEDLYKVYIVNNNGRVLDKYEGIYFDQLVETIDNRIEKLDSYRF